MLVRLSIRDIVLIERLDIDFARGLSVLTGETGAGKSILLDAFALALGARGDAALVRYGLPQGQVTAVFAPPPGHAAGELLLTHGIAAEDELILRRIQFADGRTRAFVNDQPVSAQALRAFGAALVEIHGQHDERALVEAQTHRRLLDAFGALEAQSAQVERLWEERRSREADLARQRALVSDAHREAEWLRHAVEELTALAPQAGEEASLAQRRAQMMQAEKLAGELREALEALAGTHSPVPVVAAALRRLERRSMQAPALVEPVVKALDGALHGLDDARSHLEQALAAANCDPRALERIEERLFALRAAARKYNVAADDLNALAAHYAGQLGAFDASAAALTVLELAAAEATARYQAAAQALSHERKQAASRLEQAVDGELKPLRLERASFQVEITSEPDAGGAHGIDRVEFWVRTNPGTRPGPLIKVASGGELARFLLALKVVLADRGSAPTLVFDEIDTGAGGAVADAIGVRLARLAARVQVIAVTHAPQVAARAERHYLIRKSGVDKGSRVVTRVAELVAERRREEIARMLAGAEITAEARAAAARLLRVAG
jgi:DNA repair protein RecN (Recombination protein N)